MPSIPLYVHEDGAAHLRSQVPRYRVAIMLVLGMCSVVCGSSCAGVLVLTSADSVLKGVALPLFALTGLFTGAFLVYRSITEPARIAASSRRFLNQETR